MTRAEIKKAQTNELIVAYVRTYSHLTINMNTHGGTMVLSRQCHDMEQELVKRGVLTEQDVVKLNS